MNKTILSLSLLLTALLCSCSSSYDDSELWQKVNSLDSRVTALENKLTQMNTDINRLNTIVTALQQNVYVTSIDDQGNGVYVIHFSNGKFININSGDGKNGLTPYIGTNGNWWIGTEDTGVQARGTNGKDGLTPHIGSNGTWWIGNTDTGVLVSGSGGIGTDIPLISVDEYEGVYYWVQVLNGVKTWLTDGDGNKLPVTGGSGICPILRVNTAGYWIISYDNGITFELMLDSRGLPVSANGCDCDGDSSDTAAIIAAYVSGDYLVIILKDGTVIRLLIAEKGDAVDPRLTEVVPADVIEKIGPYIHIYSGVNPPNISGAYLIDPFVTVYCEDYGNGGFAPGAKVASEVVRFSNFNNTDNTLDYDSYSGSSTESGKGAFISGDGKNFTAFFNTEGESSGIYTKTALVISGTLTLSGIKNLEYAFIMVKKGSDPNNKLMNEGIFRVFKDEDGLSVNTTWSPSSSAPAVQQPLPMAVDAHFSMPMQ